MTRRIIAAVVALLLAGVGAVLIVAYVGGAEQRAMAGVETATVLVVAKPIPAGTSAEALSELVSTEAMPAKAVAEGGVKQLDELKGMVAATDLVPGEQLLEARFTTREAMRAAGTFVLPDDAKDLHQVSVALEMQRALGGQVAAGDHVGVFMSFEPEDKKKAGDMTHLTLHRALVTKVQGSLVTAPSEEDDEAAQTPAEAPSGAIMVTLALQAADAEALVFAAEHGTIWLSDEPEGATDDGTGVVQLFPPTNDVDPTKDTRNLWAGTERRGASE